MNKLNIISENKKLNEDTFLTIILLNTDNISEIMTQIYEDNKDNIININYETETNLLTIKTKKECILKITEYTDEEIINYSNEILNELKKINNYNPSLPPENESSISLEKIINFSQKKRKQLQQLLTTLSYTPYLFYKSNIDKKNIILKNNNIPEAKIVGDNLILLPGKPQKRFLIIGREIIEECKKHQEFIEDNYKEIESINSDFKIEITPDYIIIKKDNNPFFLKYSIRHQALELEETNYLTLDVLEKVENEDLLNKIFFYPKKCPFWIQEMLKEEKEEEERLIKQIKQKIETNKNIKDKTNLVSFLELLNYQKFHNTNRSSYKEDATGTISGLFKLNIDSDSFGINKQTIIYEDYNLNKYEITISYDYQKCQFTYTANGNENEKFLKLIKPYLNDILKNIYCKKSSLERKYYYHLWKDKDFEIQKNEFLNNIKDKYEIIKEYKNLTIDDFISLKELFEIINRLDDYINLLNDEYEKTHNLNITSINSNIEIIMNYASISIMYYYNTDFNEKETFGATITFDGKYIESKVDDYDFFPNNSEERDELFSQIYFKKSDCPKFIQQEWDMMKKNNMSESSKKNPNVIKSPQKSKKLWPFG